MDVTDEGYGRRTRKGEEPLLRAAIARAELAIAARLRPSIPAVSVFSFGAVELFPGSLAIWVRVPSDVERDRLLGDPGFEAELRDLLAAAGYPEDALGRVAFTAESDQTVNRDHAGNWWYAVK